MGATGTTGVAAMLPECKINSSKAGGAGETGDTGSPSGLGAGMYS